MMPEKEHETEAQSADNATQKALDAALVRLNEAEERTLEYWLKAVEATAAGSMTVAKLQSSVSWRITRPIRAARIVQRKIREAGVRRTASMVKVRLAEIRQARKRG